MTERNCSDCIYVCVLVLMNTLKRKAPEQSLAAHRTLHETAGSVSQNREPEDVRWLSNAKAMFRHLWNITIKFNGNQPMKTVQWNCRSLRSKFPEFQQRSLDEGESVNGSRTKGHQ
jgi:hypothetical protein